MAMVSSIQEAQKDNLRNFSDHMMKVLEVSWYKESNLFVSYDFWLFTKLSIFAGNVDPNNVSV